MSKELLKCKEGKDSYIQGLEYISTSCLKCRFSPDYLSAIPCFNKAARLFHGSGNYDEEIEAREKLIRCYKESKSYWEEGNENEKLAKLKLNQLKNSESAYHCVTNAYNAYMEAKKYQDCIKAMQSCAKEYIEIEDTKYPEIVLKLGIDCLLNTIHVLSLDKEYGFHYIFEILELYTDVLFGNEKIKDSEEILKKAAKALIENKVDEKEKICKLYGFMCICELLEGTDDGEKFNSITKKAESLGLSPSSNICNQIIKLQNLLKGDINDDTKKKIKKLITDLSMDLPHNVAKLLNMYSQKQIKLISEGNSISTTSDLK